MMATETETETDTEPAATAAWLGAERLDVYRVASGCDKSTTLQPVHF
jgi:hypothetical protein